MKQKICSYCNTVYIPVGTHQYYCTPECAKQGYKQKREKWCEKNSMRLKQYQHAYYLKNKKLFAAYKKAYQRHSKG